MRKRRHGISAAVLAALLAGCAGRAIESHELHAVDGDGQLSVLVAAGAGVADFAADDRIELTFRPVPGAAPAAPGIERLVSFYRDAAPCALSEPGAAADNGDSEPPPLSIAMVQAGMEISSCRARFWYMRIPSSARRLTGRA